MELHSTPKILKEYSSDRSIYSIKPKFVFFPKSENDLIELIGYARKKKLSITARGGGSGVSGAAIGKGIVVDFSKHMNKSIKVGKVTRVQSGMLLGKLRPLLKKAKHMLPSVPIHGYCAIGGTVSTRSIGPRTLKYGTMDNQVKSVRGILSDGRIIDTSKIIPEDMKKKIIKLKKQIIKEKNLIKYLKKRPSIAGGYNLKSFIEHKKVNDIITHLIVGSTGTLILLTEVELKLPRYREIKDLYLAYFKDFDSAQKAINKIIKAGASSIQNIGEEALKVWERKYQHKDAKVALIISFETHKNIKKIVKNALQIKYIPPKKRTGLWESRALALPRLEKEAKKRGLQAPSGVDDATFDPKYFSKIMKDVKKYAKSKKVNIPAFGHIGVGSLHLRPMLDIKRNKKSLDIVSRDIFKILRKYNGTLIGEHNSGLCRSRYLKMESKKMYGYMKKVKDIFDPHDVLNPHVIFDLRPITDNIKV